MAAVQQQKNVLLILVCDPVIAISARDPDIKFTAFNLQDLFPITYKTLVPIAVVLFAEDPSSSGAPRTIDPPHGSMLQTDSGRGGKR